MSDRDDMVKIKKDGLYRMGRGRTASQFQYFAGDSVPKIIDDQLEYVGAIPDKNVDRTTEAKAAAAPANKAAVGPDNK